MSRTAIREQTFKLIYSLEVQKKENFEEAINLYIEANEITDEDTTKYMKDTIFGIEKNKKEITSQIEKNLKSDWKIDRISKVNLAILKLAIYEIQYTNVPFKVAINEAVEIAKVYSTEKSPKFIHGVLSSIIKGEEL